MTELRRIQQTIYHSLDVNKRFTANPMEGIIVFTTFRQFRLGLRV